MSNPPDAPLSDPIAEDSCDRDTTGHCASQNAAANEDSIRWTAFNSLDSVHREIAKIIAADIEGLRSWDRLRALLSHAGSFLTWQRDFSEELAALGQPVSSWQVVLVAVIEIQGWPPVEDAADALVAQMTGLPALVAAIREWAEETGNGKFFRLIREQHPAAIEFVSGDDERGAYVAH